MPVIRSEQGKLQSRTIESRRYGKFSLLVCLFALAFAINGCGPLGSSATPTPARSVTQTPWIVYVPVTTTPEPATATPLPTVTSAARVPTRTPTRSSAIVPTKAAVAATKAPTQPVAVAPSVPPATAAPACSAPSVVLLDPKNGDPRRTKETGPGSDTFRFQWVPYQPYESDPFMGYRIDIESKRGSTHINGDTVYVSHNDFLANGKLYIYDSRRIYNLASPAGGQDVVVTWKVTVIRTTGRYDGQGGMSGSAIDCSASSPVWTINLLVVS